MTDHEHRAPEPGEIADCAGCAALGFTVWGESHMIMPTFTYDPQPDPLFENFQAGVTSGSVVVHHGDPKPGDKVQVARAAVLKDDDGNGFIEIVGDFEECTVVDDGGAES